MLLARVHAARRPRRIAGAALFFLLLIAGSALLVWLFSSPIGKSRCDIGQYGAYMMLGALFALPAVLAYMLVPVLIDRYDPEPWWALGLAFAWGAVVATGFSGFINTSVGWAVQGELNQFGQAFAEGVISAPLVEEFWKGALVLGIFIVLRDEFDGVVDGVIYATFAALGFACVENILYYGRAGWTQLNKTSCNEQAAYAAVVATFVVRGILSPWGHPLYTSMTGIGLGIARETNRGWLKIVAPLVGYFVAVTLHAVWNGSALLSQALQIPIVAVTMALYLVFVALFTGVMIVLVIREGHIIRAQLRDEVLLGTLTAEELAIVGSPVGRLRASLRWGVRRGPKFVRAAATLAMKKWHTSRAMQGQKMTISADFILPLRKEISEIRAGLGLPLTRQAGLSYAQSPAGAAPQVAAWETNSAHPWLSPPGAPVVLQGSAAWPGGAAPPGAPAACGYAASSQAWPAGVQPAVLPRTVPFGAAQQPGYGPPAQPGYGPPAQPGYGPPAQPGYGPLAQPGYGPLAQPGYGPPAQQTPAGQARHGATPAPASASPVARPVPPKRG